MSLFKKHQYDLKSTQERFFETGVKNLDMANETILRMQTAVLTIVLAEMAFLGTLKFDYPHSWLGALAISFFVVGFIIFLLAIKLQHSHSLVVGRDFIQKSRDLQDYIKKTKKEYASEIPIEMQPKFNDAKTNAFTNKIMLLSYACMFFGSALVVFIAWSLT